MSGRNQLQMSIQNFCQIPQSITELISWPDWKPVSPFWNPILPNLPTLPVRTLIWTSALVWLSRLVKTTWVKIIWLVFRPTFFAAFCDKNNRHRINSNSDNKVILNPTIRIPDFLKVGFQKVPTIRKPEKMADLVYTVLYKNKNFVDIKNQSRLN